MVRCFATFALASFAMELCEILNPSRPSSMPNLSSLRSVGTLDPKFDCV